MRLYRYSAGSVEKKHTPGSRKEARKKREDVINVFKKNSSQTKGWFPAQKVIIKGKQKRELSTEEVLKNFRSVSWDEIAELMRENEETLQETLEAYERQELEGRRLAMSFFVK